MSSTRWAVPVHNPVRLRPQTVTVGGLTPSAAAYELNAEPGVYTLSGVAATVVATRVIDAQPASYTLTGVAATFEHAYPFNAEPGSYALTGTAATLAATRLFDTQPGSYTLTGSDATFTRSFDLDAQPGSYTLTGVDVTFEYTQAAAAPPNSALRAVPSHTPKPRQQVSQTISGLAPANAYELNAEPGTYTVTGIDNAFMHNIPDVWDRVVSPNYAHSTEQIIYGSRLFGGVEVITSTDYELNAEPGAFTVTGAAATLARGLFVTASPASFTVTGSAATLAATRLFDAQPGSFAVTGTAATLARGLFVNAEPGSYAVTGAAATTTHFTSILFSSTASVTTTITLSGGTQIATRIFAAAVWLLRKRKRKRKHV